MRICLPGYALVWIDNKPICQMALSANKSAFLGTNQVKPTMRVTTNIVQNNSTLYFMSSRCSVSQVATEQGTCVPKDCAERTLSACEARDIMYSVKNKTHSCVVNNNACEKHVNGNILSQNYLWWPGFVQDKEAFAGVGPAYVTIYSQTQHRRKVFICVELMKMILMTHA